MNITIASWNILNDYWARHGCDYQFQKDRLELITNEIYKIARKSDRIILFLCELEKENIDEICKKTGLVPVDRPYHYERLATLKPQSIASQYIVFLADKNTAKEVTVKSISTRNKKRDAIAMLSYKGLKIIGTHIPQRPFTDFFTRREHTRTILDQKPDIVMGDFNATPLFPTRWRFLGKFSEVHKKNRPPFPDPYYRGRNIKSWWPTMNIDVMFSKITAKQPRYSLTKASDHPLIWAEFEVE